MKVTILGSGTAVPVPGRFPAGYLCEVADTRVLVDLGPGVLRRLSETGTDLDRIDAVLLTHFHTDHCADVAALLFALRNPLYRGRPPLRLIGPEGLDELLGHLTAAWRWLEPSGYTLLREEIGPGRLELPPLEVTAVRVEHTDHSLGYRLRSPDGKVAAFTGDAIACDGVVELARDAELFVCDSAFPSAAPGPGHMTPAEAGQAAARGGARTLCLTHFYPECDGHDLLAEARQHFAGEIVLAEDLAVFDLT